MSYKIGEFVVGGDISNVTRNSVNGWIAFGPEKGLHLQLNGNLTGPFAGKRFRFYVPRADDAPQTRDPELPLDVASMPMQQIGVVGNITLCTVDDSANPHPPTNGGEIADPDETHAAERLLLEWYSQNGQVVVEIQEPQIEFVNDDEEDSVLDDDTANLINLSEAGPQTDAEDDDDDDAIIGLDDDDDDTEDPYGLFDPELQERIDASIGSTYIDEENEEAYLIDDDDQSDILLEHIEWENERRELDEDSKRLHQQLDDVFHSDKTEPIANLFDPPLELPPLKSITTDELAEPILNSVLIRLAPLSVAFDICEHCSPLDAYRILITQILPNAQIHPELAKTDIVQHYGTYDYCEQCQKEYDVDFEEKL
jgi:hypothetical protein